jgi:RHS repeat-associated protein
VNDPETGLTYMQQRYYDPMAGRFLSVDPVLTDANTGASFNRYVYANNSPYNYIDPDGRAALAGVVVAPIVLALGYKVATDPQARAFATRVFNSVVGALTPGATTSAPLLNNGNNEGSSSSASATAPPVPTDIVGDQSSSQAGETKNGKRHTSGPLTPANGGTGDAKKDFDHLTGGTGKPMPGNDSRSSVPGAQIGANGVWIRPGEGDKGSRIEIPGNGTKLPETLHY